MGCLEGRFVLDDEGQAKLESLYGKRIFFGEVLGKHSEVIVNLAQGDIRVVTDDQEFLEKARALGVSLDTGFNPISYYDNENES